MIHKKKLFFYIVCLALCFIWYKVTDPYTVDQNNCLQGISWQHILGTDYLGRDLLTRIVYGSFYSLLLAAFVLICVVGLSLILGGSAGFFGGLLDLVIIILADILMSVPSFLVALVFAGLFANSMITVTIALVISWSGKYIRYIRHLVLNIKKEEFIRIAPLRGSLGFNTFFVHVIPNLFTELLSLFITDIGKLLLSISSLSFLGIGIQPPVPELGTILYDGKAYFFVAPGLFIFPGLFLSIIVLSTQVLSQQLSKNWRVKND